MLKGLLGSGKKNQVPSGSPAASELSGQMIHSAYECVNQALSVCRDRGFRPDDVLVVQLVRARSILTGMDVPLNGDASNGAAARSKSPTKSRDAPPASSPELGGTAAAATKAAAPASAPKPARKTTSAEKKSVQAASTVIAGSTVLNPSSVGGSPNGGGAISPRPPSAARKASGGNSSSSASAAAAAAYAAAESKMMAAQRSGSTSPRKSLEDTLNDLLQRDVFNQLIPDVLTALLKYQPRSPQYLALKAAPGDPQDKAGFPQQERWRQFTSLEVPRIMRDEKSFPSKRMKDDARKAVVSSASLQKSAADAYVVLYSPKLCCAGVIGGDTNCKHSKPQDGRTKLTLETYHVDHLISVHSIGRLWDTICARIDQQPEPSRPMLKLKLLDLTRHLLYGMRTELKFGWPPNVHLRCEKCFSSSSDAFGGSTHEKIVEGVYWVEQSGSASPRKK